MNSNSGNLAASTVGFGADNHAAGFVAFSSGYDGGFGLSHFAGRAALLTDLSNPGNGLDFVSAKASGDMRFYTGGFVGANERMRLTSTGGLAIGSTDPGSNTLKVTGDFEVTGACTGCSSDERLKKNVLPLSGSSLQKLLSIKGVTFEWSEEQKAKDFPGLQVGVIAQDVEKAFPEIVGTDARGYKFVRYDKLIAPTIEAIREQQGQINTIDAKVASMGTGVSQNMAHFAEWVDSRWQVVAEVVFTKSVNFKDRVTFAATTLFTGKAEFQQPITQAKDSAGNVMLPSGAQSVEVTFTTAYDSAPFVTLTPVGKGVTGYYVDQVTKTGFTIKVEQSLSQDVLFNWAAIQTTTGAVAGTTAPVASVVPSPSPLVSPTPSINPSPTPAPTISPSPTASPQVEVSPTPVASESASQP